MNIHGNITMENQKEITRTFLDPERRPSFADIVTFYDSYIEDIKQEKSDYVFLDKLDFERINKYIEKIKANNCEVFYKPELMKRPKAKKANSVEWKDFETFQKHFKESKSTENVSLLIQEGLRMEKQGLLYLQKKEINEAEENFCVASDEYNLPESSYQLSLIYFRKDYLEKAKTYLMKAVKQQHGDSISLLGELYEGGIIFDKDLQKAFTYYHQSSKLDSQFGLFNLGRSYLLGIGVSIDKSKALQTFKLFISHFSKKNNEASNNYNYLYEIAKAVSTDSKIMNYLNYLPVLQYSKIISKYFDDGLPRNELSEYIACLSDYEYIKKIGGGGFGSVILVRNKNTKEYYWTSDVY